jgi:hypothetical protein
MYPPKKEFDCDRRPAGNPGQLLMVTGCESQRKRHASHWDVPSKKFEMIHALSGVISR